MLVPLLHYIDLENLVRPGQRNCSGARFVRAYYSWYPRSGRTVRQRANNRVHIIIIDLGNVTISGGMVFDPDQQMLTCISTGGPATTVTWTKDSTTVTEGAQTLLENPVTAQYTHTLTVTTGGEYTCTVENNKPSFDSATIILPGEP